MCEMHIGVLDREKEGEGRALVGIFVRCIRAARGSLTSRVPGKAAPVEVNIALLERAEAALHAVLVLLDRIEGLRCGDLEFLAGALGDLANEVESTRRFAVRRGKFEERKIVPQREIVSAVHIFGVDTRVARVWCSMEHRLDIMVTQMSLQFSTAS